MLHQESQHTEWKETWRDDYLRCVCGFANAQGGRLLLGVNDKSRVVGLPDKPKSRLQKYRLTALGRQWITHHNKP